MGSQRLFTVRTGVLILFVSAVSLGSTRFARGADETDSAKKLLEGIEKLNKEKTKSDDQCFELNKTIVEAAKEFSNACEMAGLSSANCAVDEEMCTNDKSRVTGLLRPKRDSDLKGDKLDPKSCDEIIKYIDKGCGHWLNLPKEKNNEQERKELRTRVKELREKGDKLGKEGRKDVRDLEEQLRNSDKDAAKADEDRQKQKRDISEKMQEIMKNADAEKTRGMAELRKKMDEIDVEYIKMKDKHRRLESAVLMVQASKQIDCRAAADAEARVYEADLDKRIAEEAKQIRRWSLSTSSGKKFRETKEKRRLIVNRYNLTFSSCISGRSPQGAAIQKKIMETEQERINTLETANNQAARLEKLRQESMTSLQELQNTIETTKATTLMQQQQRINEIDTAAQRDMMQRWTDKAQVQNRLNETLKDNRKEIENNEELLEDANENLATASGLASCNIPEERIADLRKGRNTLKGARLARDLYCSQYNGMCAGKPAKNGGTYATLAPCQNSPKEKEKEKLEEPISLRPVPSQADIKVYAEPTTSKSAPASKPEYPINPRNSSRSPTDQ